MVFRCVKQAANRQDLDTFKLFCSGKKFNRDLQRCSAYRAVQLVDQIGGEAALLVRYLETLEKTGEPELVQAAIDLAFDNLQAARTDFTLPRVQGRALQRLQNRGLLVPVGYGLYRFRHEQLLFFLYACGATERDVPPSTLLRNIAGRHAEPALVWVLRLYRHQRRSRALAEYLGAALGVAGRLSFFEKATLIDEILSWSDICSCPGALEVVQGVVTEDASLERYFFKHLSASQSPEWLGPLRERGFFDSPPAPVERDGRTLYRPWPALQYLVAMASVSPGQVVGIAGSLHSRDSWTMVELVRAARSMPEVKAARMVPLTVRWADEGMMVEENVVSLANYLAHGDQWDAALGLVDLILSPQEEQASDRARQSPFFRPTAVSKARQYAVQAFLEKDLDTFLESVPLEILRIVTRNLEEAIAIESGDGRDSSFVWRPAIEPHEQNMEFWDVKNALVDAAERTLRFVAGSMPGQAREIVERYLHHEYAIFQRLAIHTIRLNSDLWPELVEPYFADPRYLEDIDLHHECWLLIHDTYGSLSPAARHEFAELLLARLRSTCALSQPHFHRERHSILRWLWAIKEMLPADEHSQALAELVGEYGEPPHPDFLVPSSTSSGTASPKSWEELSTMSHQAILACLRQTLPVREFDEPSQTGLADALRAAVAAKPEHFAPIAPKLIASDILPRYAHHALWGFQEALKKKGLFDWEPVLQLCEVVAETHEEESEAAEAPDMMAEYREATYAGARLAVARLLEAGVARDENGVPPGVLARVRDILIVLADDPNPSREYERRASAERPSGVLDLSLNVTRGKAVAALIQYALHVAQTIAEEHAPVEPTRPTSRMEPEVRDKLTEKLDSKLEPSRAVHSLFGQYLPQLHYLDEEWTTSHLEEIFPRDPGLADYWEAAWEGYLLLQSRYYVYLFEILRPYYQHAVEQVALGDDGRVGSEAAQQRLARNLALAYSHGVETLETPDSVIAAFFDSAPDDVRAGFIIGLGVTLRGATLSSQSEEWLRCKTLWEARSRAIPQIEQAEGHASDVRRELAAYADWVPFIPEDLKDWYDSIEKWAPMSENPAAIRLLEHLASVVKEHTRFAVTLFEKLLKQDRGPWFFRTERPTARTILKAAMTSSDEEAWSCAVRVINLFGERGEERYRDLLKLG